jgi:hypothetical protein
MALQQCLSELQTLLTFLKAHPEIKLTEDEIAEQVSRPAGEEGAMEEEEEVPPTHPAAVIREQAFPPAE